MKWVWHKKRKLNEDDIEELIGVVKERKRELKVKYKINHCGLRGIIIGMIGNLISGYLGRRLNTC